MRPSRHRDMQMGRDGGRKLFKGKLRKVFLEWFAATGNCVFSAAKAGVCHQTVWKHRMADPDFAEAFDRALDQGVVRAKARLVEDKAKAPIAIDGDLDAVELEPADPERVLRLVGAQARAKAGGRRRQRTRARIATNAEVEAALRKRLAVFARRERALGRGKDAQPPGPLHQPSPSATAGPPPRSGEEL
ncbi:MAG: hypothetical protein ACJ8EB_00280 [Allosphingosinicella sp.]